MKIRIYAIPKGVSEPHKVIGEAMKAHVSMMKTKRGHEREMRVLGPHVMLGKPPHPHVWMRMTPESLRREIGRMVSIR